MRQPAILATLVSWMCGFTLLGLLFPSSVPGQSGGKTADLYKEARLKMVTDELAREGISHDGVLEAMKTVPRHLFVSPDLRVRAYLDTSLPIGYKQTISPPFLVAYMTQALDPKPGNRVLEIGTGSGYQAAVLARLVKEVYSIEIVEPLGLQAAKRFQELGYKNVKTKVGDGYQGWPEHAPFDRIIVTCSPENVPQPLVDQLREGGKMIIPLGEQFQQVFYLLEKRKGELSRIRLIPTCFVPMTGKAEEQRAKRPDSTVPQLVNGDFEKQENGRLAGWYGKREPVIVRREAPEGQAYVLISNAEAGRGSGIFQTLGVEGERVRRLRVALHVKGEAIQPGLRRNEQPCLSVVFADGNIRPLGEAFVGPWQGTFNWQQVSKTIDVPRQTRFILLGIGLNGGTGSLSVDDVRLEPELR